VYVYCQVDAIAKVEGIDVLLIGPYDLGNNIGHPVTGDFAPEVLTAMETIRKAAANAGKKSGIYATSGEQARSYADQGFNMVGSCSCMQSLAAVADVGTHRSR
jgi:4-hydroxy-2-oxoheptanedioate aldolase